MDWLPDHIVGLMTDLRIRIGCHGSIKYANKELPFSSKAQGTKQV